MYAKYAPNKIDKIAQNYWDETASFKVIEDINKEKFYCLSMLPYPSGNIHMGHVRNYTIGDVISRYQKMLGKNVLQPLGWDAFGLPAENAALKNKIAPSVWTYKNIEQMRATLKQLGFAIDWSREITTCKADYYKFEQQLFLNMYKKKLAYKKKSIVNWDPIDQTVLANEQVIDGKGWRSGAIIEQKEITQWFLKISAYADELLTELDHLSGWPDKVKIMQKNWIGRSDGVEIFFDILNCNEKLTIFTTRPDTIYGVTFIVIAPDHNIAKLVAEKDISVNKFLQNCKKIVNTEAVIAKNKLHGYKINLFAKNPMNGDKIPIYISNYATFEYGTKAIMGVPAHNLGDFEFAKKYNLNIKQVIKPYNELSIDLPFTTHGVLFNSNQFSNLDSIKAINIITEYIIKNSIGNNKINYRLRDWGISRQRYWGCPIPIINCSKCGLIPVNEKDLPVILPENITLENPQSPLAKIETFVKTTCPKCNKPALRETDTFDTFIESSWYYLQYCCGKANIAESEQKIKYWMPVDQYIGGIEHAILHLLYSRFIYKVIRDEKFVDSNEPFLSLLTQGMVLKDGFKMSKQKGNIVSPTELIESYGADAVRFFIIFAAPPEASIEWSQHGLEGSYRFLKRLYEFAFKNHEVIIRINASKNIQRHSSEFTNDEKVIFYKIQDILNQINIDIARLHLNTLASGIMKIMNILFDISKDNGFMIYHGMNIILRILYPIAPHITHYLWKELMFNSKIENEKWPNDTIINYDISLNTNTTMIVQVNGKMRSKLIINRNLDEEIIKKLAVNQKNVLPFVQNKTIKNFIIISNKLINIVTN